MVAHRIWELGQARPDAGQCQRVVGTTTGGNRTAIVRTVASGEAETDRFEEMITGMGAAAIKWSAFR